MEDGIYTDISIRDYHMNGTHVSASSIKEAKVSLKQYHWYRTGKMPRKEGAHMDLGNAFELALLDRKGFESDVAIMQTEYWKEKANEGRVKAYKSPASSKVYQELQDKFFADNKGKYVITDVGNHSYESIEKMLESCYSDPTIRKLIEGIEYQLSLFWTDKETDFKLKTRPDICKTKKNVVVNLKTAVDGSPKAFSRELVKWDYPLQACVEITGCIESGLMPRVDNYFWLVVEKEPPYNATIYEFEKSDISVCMDEFRYLVNIISEAEKNQEFPGYTQQADNRHGILQAYIPAYYKQF